MLRCVLILTVYVSMGACRNGPCLCDGPGSGWRERAIDRGPGVLAPRAVGTEAQAQAAAKHGIPRDFTNELGMRFVLVPAGAFRRLSDDDGDLIGEVRVSQPFYAQVTEVTNSQYRRYEARHDSGVYRGRSLNLPSQPAVNVSWDEANRFAAWISAGDVSRTYRLPTEAEWELMCRAGTGSRFGVCDDADALANYGNFSDRNDPMPYPADRPDLDDGHSVTAPVASYRANPWGLYDLNGNASEWCADWYADYPAGAVVDPTGPGFAGAPEYRLGRRHPDGVMRYARGKTRVVRGGSWAGGSYLMQCGSRHHMFPQTRTDETGFRLVVPVR